MLHLVGPKLSNSFAVIIVTKKEITKNETRLGSKEPQTRSRCQLVKIFVKCSLLSSNLLTFIFKQHSTQVGRGGNQTQFIR